jgi:RHS repeat-associated protein
VTRRNNSGTFTNAVVNGYQVTHVRRASDNAVMETYGYDMGGRVTTVNRGGTNATLAYNPADQLTGYGSTTYTFDAAGRRTRSGGGVTRRFVVAPTAGTDLEVTHLVTDGAGAVQALYVYHGDQPVVRFTVDANGVPVNPVYYLEDAQGSITALVTSTGAVTRFRYDGFGQGRTPAGHTDPAAAGTFPTGAGGDFRFHGMWLEADTGFYHLRARDYDPVTGRFLSRDPLEGVTASPESYHVYNFADSNPHVYTDPTGEMSLIEINISNAIQSGMQVGRGIAVARMKQYARDTIVDTFTDVAVNSLLNLFPGAKEFNALFTDGKFGAGIRFDNMMTDAICKSLPEGTKRHLHLGVPIRDDGTPTGDGVSCKERDSRLHNGGGRGVARPDFVLSPVSPTQTSRGGGGDKAYLVGDFKLSGNSLHSKYVASKQTTQLKAIGHFARKRCYAPVAVFITIKSGDEKRMDEVRTAMRSAGLKQGTLLYVFSAQENISRRKR